ncbi:MAG TPA: STAS domain-containing protein [Caulobacteraceae bacterium]|nr:STAS domain-containing protein [Caulobacteraceae bacterium]
MNEPAAQVALAGILDLTEARPLAEALAAVRGRPLQVNAFAVERLGALCLQVLVAARRTWAADGAPFAIVGASPAFAEQSARLGALGLVG